MSNRAAIVGALVCSMLGGCVAPEHGGDELELRSGTVDAAPWWELDLTYPGNGPIVVRQGDRDDPDAILWDLDGGSVSRQTDAGNEDVLVVADNELQPLVVSPSGADAPLFTVERTDHPSEEVFQLLDDEGDVVFTMWKRYVFAGEPALSSTPKKTARDASNLLVMSFRGKRVHAGDWKTGPRIAKADQPIANANPVRRLLVAALLSNECGLEIP